MVAAAVTEPGAAPGAFARALAVTGALSVTVHGRSMRPFHPPDRRLLVRPLVAGEPLLYRVVVAVDTHGRQLAHRVVADRRPVDGTLVLRGDASMGVETVAEEAVAGVVTAARVGERWLSVERVPAPLRGGLAWLGRQLVVAPMRLARLSGRAPR